MKTRNKFKLLSLLIPSVAIISSCSSGPLVPSSVTPTSSESSSEAISSSAPSSEPSVSSEPAISSEVSSETSSLPPSSSSEEPIVGNDKYRTYYQLLVYSFADSDGDGIGDFKGIADKLDYLENLGIQGIWLSPVLKASSYHAYDTEDYYTINPKYNAKINGKTYDIKYLLDECHKRDIKVLMDLVLNHTSYNHTWYKEHRDWYGYDDRFGFPEFNFDISAPRNAVKEVGQYWLNQGFDGFRLDAAMWIYNSGSNRHNKNYQFWSEWCSAMRETKDDCYLIAEVLDSNHDLAYQYANAGFDSTFDFNTVGNVVNMVKNNNKNYATLTANNIKKASDINPNYILGRALSNHDIGRFNQSHPDSSDKAYYVENINQIKLANAVNALTPGNTFIYYGDEIGLKGTCEGTAKDWYYDMNFRTPMPWISERTDSVKYFENFHDSGVTTSVTFSGKSIEQDVNDDSSIYSCLKRALHVKNNSVVLQRGTVSAIPNLDSSLNGFDVTLNGTTIRVVVNCTNKTIDYTINDQVLYTLKATISNNVASLSQYSLVAYQL